MLVSCDTRILPSAAANPSTSGSRSPSRPASFALLKSIDGSRRLMPRTMAPTDQRPQESGCSRSRLRQFLPGALKPVPEFGACLTERDRRVPDSALLFFQASANLRLVVQIWRRDGRRYFADCQRILWRRFQVGAEVKMPRSSLRCWDRSSEVAFVLNYGDSEGDRTGDPAEG